MVSQVLVIMSNHALTLCFPMAGANLLPCMHHNASISGLQVSPLQSRRKVHTCRVVIYYMSDQMKKQQNKVVQGTIVSLFKGNEN